tara:strand:- start:1361 stop:2062 length:702 start_codon:yes stop_codon:yes gene_type:complete
MAVGINKVYNKVLAIANKEQRGYIVPQEFNLFADLAQLEIFEQYFYDKNQFMRVHGNDGEYSDIIHNLNEKINIFERTASVNANGQIQANDFYRLGTVIFNGDTEVEEVEPHEILYMNKSPLMAPTVTRPVYVRSTTPFMGIMVQAYPSAANTNLTCTYIKKPTKPQWGYVVINDRAMYDGDSSVTTNFELHSSEENELVYKILKLAGVSMKRQDIATAGQGLETSQIQQEKQ